MAIQELKKYTYNDSFSLSIVQFEKACVFNKPEQIELYSMYWIKKGKGRYYIDFKSYDFEDNVLFFLSPGQVFSVDSEKIKEAYKLSFHKDFYCIQTHDREVACNGVLFNNSYESPFVKPQEQETIKLDYILNEIIEEISRKEAAQYDMLQTYLKQFIIHAVRIKKDCHPLTNDSDSKLYKDFSVLVEQHFKTTHGVTDYANRLGLSPKSLTKHLQKIGKPSPSSFIKERIVLEAKRQLLYSNDSVKQIAYNLGFNDAAYFARFFKKATSKSALQFKKDYKQVLVQ